METITAPKLKIITWATNYNNKMDCTGFVHLDLAPEQMPARGDVDKTVFEIKTLDKSHEPIRVAIYDIMCFNLQSLTDALAIASHGITAGSFIKFIKQKYPEKVINQHGIALYYYLKN